MGQANVRPAIVLTFASGIAIVFDLVVVCITTQMSGQRSERTRVNEWHLLVDWPLHFIFGDVQLLLLKSSTLLV